MCGTVLVFGAGVLGYNLARNPFRTGKDVTLLARGRRADEIQTNGLRIKDLFSPRVSVSRIPVTTTLQSDDAYDVIFVALRYTQLDSILGTRHASRVTASSSRVITCVPVRLPLPCRIKTCYPPLQPLHIARIQKSNPKYIDKSSFSMIFENELSRGTGSGA